MWVLKPKTYLSPYMCSTEQSITYCQCFERIKLKQSELVCFWALNSTSSSPVCSVVVNNEQLGESRLTAQGWIPTSGGLQLATGLNQWALYCLVEPQCAADSALWLWWKASRQTSGGHKGSDENWKQQLCEQSKFHFCPQTLLPNSSLAFPFSRQHQGRQICQVAVIFLTAAQHVSAKKRKGIVFLQNTFHVGAALTGGKSDLATIWPIHHYNFLDLLTFNLFVRCYLTTFYQSNSLLK